MPTLYPPPWDLAASVAPAGRTPQGLLTGAQIMAAYPPAHLEARSCLDLAGLLSDRPRRSTGGLEAPAGIDPNDELR